VAATQRNVIRWGIVGVGAAILLLNVPNMAALSGSAALLLIACALTIVAVIFSLALVTGALSLAHGIGMVACLSVPTDAQAGALWAIAVGALVGEGIAFAAQSVMRYRGQARAAFTTDALLRIVGGAARAAISLYAASLTLQVFGAPLPLSAVNSETLLPVFPFVMIYVGCSAALYWLDARVLQPRPPTIPRPAAMDRWRAREGSAVELLAALILPMPFAFLAAEAYAQASRTSFALLIAALMLVILFMYGISHAHLRLRRRMDELEALAALGETLRTSTALQPLTQLIETHVRALMDVRDVDIALIEPRAPLSDSLTLKQYGLTQRVQATGVPLLLSAGVRAGAAAHGITAAADIASWLGVPLISGGTVTGALAVISHSSARLFDRDDLRRLTIIAAGASIALENARRQAEQTARVEQLVTLNHILALLSGSLSPEGVLDTIITSASALSGASAVTVYLAWDDQTALPMLVRCAGFSDDLMTHLSTPLLIGGLQNGTGSGQAPSVVADVQTDARAAHLRAAMIRDHKRAWIELPLNIGGIRRGVIGLYFDAPLTLNAEGVELLRTFANQAAQAIDNARMFAVTDEALERRVGQLLALAAIGQELTAIINLNTICDVLIRHALDAVLPRAGASAVGYMALISERIGSIEAWAARGYPDETFRDPDARMRGAWAAIGYDTNPILRVSADDMPPEYALLPTSRAVILAPIRRGDLRLGVLALETDRADGFTFDDCQFIGQLATQAVIAIDNARLFRRIAEALDRLQVILNAMDEAILLIDADGQIALANPRVTMLGLAADELIGRDVNELIGAGRFVENLGFSTPADLTRVIADARGTWTERPAHKYTLASENGAITLLRQMNPIYDEEERPMGVLLVFHDESEAAQLAQAREDFSRMIVHDLRGPLMAITTSLSILTSTIPKDSPYRPIIETTSDANRRSIRKLLGRVNALLDVARLESGQIALELQPTDMATLIDGACIELSPLAHELNIKLVTDIPDDLPLLNIDADKMERVLLNLIDNALKFSPLDSTISVRVTLPTTGADAGYARIDVIDSGPGIPDEDKMRLFERFAQIQGRRGRRRGTGLGLTFCRLVAEAHGGRIWVEDNPAGGSIFAFTVLNGL
jgi:PAS domain S-box-containing protein